MHYNIIPLRIENKSQIHHTDSKTDDLEMVDRKSSPV